MPSLFSGCRGGTHPLAVGPVKPRPLPRPGRSDRQRRRVPQKPGPGRQIVSKDNPSGVSRIGGQAGTQAPDPTPTPPQNRGSRAGSTTNILPAESGAASFRAVGLLPAHIVAGSVPRPSRRRGIVAVMSAVRFIALAAVVVLAAGCAGGSGAAVSPGTPARGPFTPLLLTPRPARPTRLPAATAY